MKKPRVGITTGCPCGIGPEIVSKALSDLRVLKICEPRVFGNLNDKINDKKLCGEASMKAVDDAARAVMSGDVDAIVTAPINKHHWKMAGSPFLGHTEYLAHVSGARNVAMMMASPKLCVSLVTTHIPLADVSQSITIERICEVARLTCRYLTILQPDNPVKIAVCALNPHAGESGTIGNEEKNIIIPAIEILQREHLPVGGPYPADTVFNKAIGGDFGAVVTMYHDQALPVIKTLDFAKTVNVTLGLPFIRTSPDHGTAQDIAGKGVASHENMVSAIEHSVALLKKTF